MKSRHNVNPHWQPPPEPISDRYQAEVDAATTSGERRVRQAQARLARAEARLARAETIRSKAARQREMAVANELCELRRQELLAVQRSMMSVPASLEHRGRGAHLPPIQPHTL